MNVPEQVERILEFNRCSETVAEKQQVLGALIDAMIAQVPKWAGVLAFPAGPMLQDARGLFLDALEEVIEEGMEVRLVLSGEVKQRLAEKRAFMVARDMAVMVAELKRNPDTSIALPQYLLDHLMNTLQPGKAPARH